MHPTRLQTGKPHEGKNPVMTDFSLRAARVQLGALLAALGLAIVIALGITTGAFVLSFAVQRDLARQALIPEHLTWIFPAIVDSAILGATIAIVIISKLNMNKRDRGFYIALAVSVVVISILGNAYHAYHAAVAAREFIDGGGDLGFSPLAPAIAAAIAIIPPALVLAFTHGITVLVKAVGMAYAAYREIVETGTATDDAMDTASDLTADRDPMQPDLRDSVPRNIAAQLETEHATDATVDASHTNHPAAVADFAQPSSGRKTIADSSIDDLIAFIDQSDLTETVKDTAIRKLENPSFTWERIAQDSQPPVVVSTAWRRYEKFDSAARAAGFDSPPLPDLRAAENAVDWSENETETSNGGPMDLETANSTVLEHSRRQWQGLAATMRARQLTTRSTDEVADMLRMRFDDKKALRAIGEHFNVTHSTVSNIVQKAEAVMNDAPADHDWGDALIPTYA